MDLVTINFNYMKKYKIIISTLMAMLFAFAFTSCKEERYNEIEDLFQPRLINEPLVESNNITIVWYEINDAESYTIETHLDGYYKSIFEEYETKEPFIVLNDIPYGTRFYIRIRSNSKNAENNSTWTYTNALTEVRPEYAKILREVKRAEIGETNVTIKWEVDKNNPVDSITVIPHTVGLDKIAKKLTTSEIEQGYVEITGLVKSSLYNVNIYDSNKPKKYDKPYNQITFRTAGPSGESVMIERGDDLLSILMENNDNPEVTDGTEYYLPAGSYYKITAFNLKKGFKLVGSTEGVRPQIEQEGWWNVEPESYISDFEFENIDFVQYTDAQYFFNANSTFTLENVSFFNCSFTGFARGFWRHQGSNLYKNIKSFTIDNCIVDKCGGFSSSGTYGTFHLGSNGADDIENVVITNTTFMRDAGNMSNLFFHNTSEYPIHLEFRNITIYDYSKEKQLININNAYNSTFIFKNVLLASSCGTIYTAPGDLDTSFADNYVTTDYLLGPSSVDGIELGINALELFNDPINGDLSIKDPNSPIIKNRVGDSRWLP